MPLYRWARGFEWSVTFLSVNTVDATTGYSLVKPLSSPNHGLNAPDASVSIRVSDCTNCIYVTYLVVWNTYFLRIRAHNANGYGAYSVTQGVPQEIPGPPSAVNASSVSGTQIKVSFSPPSGYNTDISQYTIEWDTNADFSTVSSGLPLPASCATVGYGMCQVVGAAISVIPPYTFVIELLSINTMYFVRVAARNSVSLQTTDPTRSIADNTKWSEIVNTATSNQPPSAPVQVQTTVSGLSFVQVLITPPVDNGGMPITSYIIEWDASKNFDDLTTYGKISVLVANLPKLSVASGILVYELSNLGTGLSYWVRVSAVNAIETSRATMITTSVTPAGKPNNPSSVTLSTASTMSTPITTTNVTWTEPSTGSSTNPDGGSPVSGYLVEWWQGGSVPEVQLVQYLSSTYPAFDVGSFTMEFGPATGVTESTGSLAASISPYTLRSELMNLGYTSGFNKNFTYDNVVGNLNIAVSIVPNKGYQWMITFLDSSNTGDQVQFVATLTQVSNIDTVSVIRITDGQRKGGFHEVQLLSIMSAGSTLATDLGGWFTLSFNGSQSTTQWLSVSSSQAVVQRALGQLNTLRAVTVTMSTITQVTAGINYAGYQWVVTFSGDIGNQPVLLVDTSRLFTSKTQVVVTMSDGDNSLNSNGVKATAAMPGEMPAGYNSRVVDKDSRSYIISNLVPGNTYYVAVSAVNNYGVGASTLSAPLSTTPPKQIPQPPVDVTVNVHPGSSTSLDVKYAAPHSDGGSNVLSYRIELDTSPQFSNSIFSSVLCPTASLHSVFQITTTGGLNDPITSGYYQLALSVNGNNFLSDFVPYDATAMKSDEEGLSQIVSGLYGYVTSGSTTVKASKDPSLSIFVNDRLTFDNQLFAGEVFTVTHVNTSYIVVNVGVRIAHGLASPMKSSFYRYLGGRGNSGGSAAVLGGQVSRVACFSDVNLCTTTRRQASGSIQSKLEMIPQALVLGVDVDRTVPDSTNGVTWRVTFLDNSPNGPQNFKLAVATGSNSVTTASGLSANITITKLLDGVNYLTCTGTTTVPPDKALSNGQYYYSRVFAINEVGYSVPQISSTSQKPMISPGAPTSVSLSVYSQTELRVVFNPPASDGGDTITAYLVEYSTTSSFSPSSSLLVTYLSGGAPFFKTITGLQTGVFVFVRVSAMNSQGYGVATISTPSSLNPYQASDAPSNVQLRSTSGTMLTVSFGQPFNNGGDAITGYRVEWDTAPSFNGLIPAPNKGYVNLDATSFSSYTIQYLTQGQIYYVRVSAINSAGLGNPALSTPGFAAPGLQVPGRPHTILAQSGDLSGQIKLSWQRPRVPWHTIPCSGLNTSPNDCPTPVGGALPASDGGTPILEYAVSYNELEDFSGFDSGEQTTTNTLFVLTNLTPGRQYYVRVLARNAQGAGLFCSYTEPNCLIVFTPVSAVATAVIQ